MRFHVTMSNIFKERWLSGRKQRFTKPSLEQSNREFESRPLRSINRLYLLNEGKIDVSIPYSRSRESSYKWCNEFHKFDVGWDSISDSC